MTMIYLGLGSNVGDRQKNMERALELLGEEGIKIDRTSKMYEAEPVGYTDQDWFLNMAAQVETDVSPEELVTVLQRVEKSVGRKETFKWGPRVIDIDVLFYGNELLETKMLTVPHPHLHERRFVLQPLSELAPELIHPGFNKTIIQLLKECPDTAIVRPL